MMSITKIIPESLAAAAHSIAVSLGASITTDLYSGISNDNGREFVIVEVGFLGIVIRFDSEPVNGYLSSFSEEVNWDVQAEVNGQSLDLCVNDYDEKPEPNAIERLDPTSQVNIPPQAWGVLSDVACGTVPEVVDQARDFIGRWILQYGMGSLSPTQH